MDKLKAFLQALAAMSDQEFEESKRHFYNIHLEKGEALVQQGKICRQIAFVKQGSLKPTMKKNLFLLALFFCPIIIWAQKTPTAIQKFTKTETTYHKNVLLQELLNKTEDELKGELIPFAYIDRKSYPLKGDINLTATRKTIRNQSSTVVLYWKVKNSDQVVLILAGYGLWDIIGGFLLLDQSSKQIENIVFGHKAETPGLGDKITERAFEERFIGRQLNNTHTFLVQKKMKENPAPNTYPIEGVSGASITVEGVTDMLNQAASSYSELLHNK